MAQPPPSSCPSNQVLGGGRKQRRRDHFSSQPRSWAVLILPRTAADAISRLLSLKCYTHNLAAGKKGTDLHRAGSLALVPLTIESQ